MRPRPPLALALVLASNLGACGHPAAAPAQPERATPAQSAEPEPALSLADFHSFDARPWPTDAANREADVCFDLGAWFGFALPDDAHLGSFAGPYDLRRPGWLGARGLGLELDGMVVSPAASRVEREPGLLRQKLRYVCEVASCAGPVDVTLELWFDSSTQLSVRAELRSETATELAPRWSGELFDGPSLATHEAGLSLRSEGRATALELRFEPAAELALDGQRYRAELPTLPVAPSSPLTLLARVASEPDARPPDETRADNRQRWQAYAEAAAGVRELPPADLALAIKSVETLIANWRTPDADIPHAGLFPAWAYDGFHGFWAWDSWKHAAALAVFEPELAREQVRLMFALAREDGMVPDVVYPGDEEDNWRDTKPPLATWAVEAIYTASDDLAFVEAMIPALLRYHAWWYRDRDHDQDGLCEYGSTDGTRIAAAWESGMDNAVRFDATQIVENHAGAFSFDQESVDLNAYLVAEKRALARLLRALGRGDEAERFADEATALTERVQQEFWDDERGWFRDRRLSGEFAAGMGPEGWIPLWAGVATPAQAARVRDSMIDPARFGTAVPLGTLAADDPAFDPQRGYWRGPVWLDQAYFGLAGLRRYGFEADADALEAQLLDHAAGLRGGAAIRENYHPLTGAGQNARHFSWSAASVLLMLWRTPAPS